MKKVLLTGAKGLIGKYAIEPLLKAGFEVFAVCSSNPPKNISNINWVKSNLLDLSQIKTLFEEIKPQYLLHFAWDTTPGSYLESDLNYKWLESSMEMLRQFQINGGKKAVYAGTCFEYKFKDEPLKETDELNPTYVYSKCKAELNKQAKVFAEESGIDFGWGRIFYVYGEGEHEKRLVPHVIKSLKEDKEVSITVGDLIKDYMFAGDIASAFVKFLDSDVTGDVNICTGTPITVGQIASTIGKKLNKEHLIKITNEKNNIEPQQKSDIKQQSRVGLPAHQQKANNTSVAAADQPKMILGDNSRLKNEVKFECKYSLDKGLDKIIESLK